MPSRTAVEGGLSSPLNLEAIVVLLATHLLERVLASRGVPPLAPSEGVLQALRSSDWPEDLRELERAGLGASVLFRECGLDLPPDDARATAGEDDQMAWHSLTGGPLDAPTPGATTPGGPIAERSLPSEAPGVHVPVPTIGAGLPVVGQLGGLSLDDYLRRVEAECIASALAASGGNKSRAARLLGIKRSTLGDRIVRCGLERADA